MPFQRGWDEQRREKKAWSTSTSESNRGHACLFEDQGRRSCATDRTNMRKPSCSSKGQPNELNHKDIKTTKRTNKQKLTARSLPSSSVCRTVASKTLARPVSCAPYDVGASSTDPAEATLRRVRNAGSNRSNDCSRR